VWANVFLKRSRLSTGNQEAVANGGGIKATLDVINQHDSAAKLIEAAAGLLAMLAIQPGASKV
jgi:hypothetical protein